MRVGDVSTKIPLSGDEFERLAELLEEHSPFDTNGLLGVLHAAAIAPTLLHPSVWLPLVLADDPGDDCEAVHELVGLLLRLHKDIVDAFEHDEAMLPDPDDVDACESFAAGYASSAALDPMWIGDPPRWTFASPIAYLGGRLDLVPQHTLEELDALPDVQGILRRDLGGMVRAAFELFRKLRQADPLRSPTPEKPHVGRVRRNDPCPCGSGKKYKRCCIERERLSSS